MAENIQLYSTKHIPKNMYFTKDIYVQIITEARLLMLDAQKEGMPPEILAELYGIYYNAYAGLIRAGSSMYRKIMSRDGYPEFSMQIENKLYPCKDVAIRDIFKEEYDNIVSPFEDASSSYVHPYVPISGENKDDIFFDPSGKHGGGINININGTFNKNTNPLSGISDSLKERAEQKAEKKELKKMERTLQKDTRGFEYDPNYDHYYSDRLPEVLEELDYVPKDSIIKGFCVLMSVMGIVLSLLFL